MLKNYGVIYFDRIDNKWKYKYELTKKECRVFINQLELGKDFISAVHIIKMIDAWSSYDGLFMKGGKLCETNSIH